MINQGGFLGVVVAAYPDGNAVDVLLKDGSRIYGAQVQVNFGSSGTGEVDLPDPGLPNDESRWNLTMAPEYYIRACVNLYDGLPIVAGFILPQVTQMTFKQKNRRIMRHASDVYSTIDQFGNIEVVHPAGFYIRIGEGSAHEDLTGKDVDQKWKTTKNTARAVNLHIQMPGGKAALNIAPDGTTTYDTAASLTANVGTDLNAVVGGNVNVTATGTATVKAAAATIDAPTTHMTGNASVDGSLTVIGAITGSGGLAVSGGAGASVTGSISQTGGSISTTGDVTAGTISLKNHHHTAQGNTAPTTPAQA